MDPQYSFGVWLKRRRKGLDLTQADLAQQLDCSVAAVRKFEAEERRPSGNIVDRLATIFGIPTEERTAFLRFARGDWYFSPASMHEGSPWRAPDTASSNDSPANQPSYPTRHRSNLPAQLTSFVGRERELVEVRRLLETSRLVTLTGAGGSGKTRLALEAAAGSIDAFPDGIWLVELAPLSEPALIPSAVAAALGMVDDKDLSLIDALASYLRDRCLLLLLDNCEHLIAEAARVANVLLQNCPKLSILATSREPLGMAGETVWLAPILSLPPPDEQLSVHSLAEYDAIRLFVERAAAVLPSFALTEQNAEAVALLCRQLDGLPLAIELAASRVKLLRVGQIVARLDDRFRLLTGGGRAAPPRHQTLRALIDWSYDLLSPAEQRLLRRLSVFAGGFTLEAAEAIGDKENAGDTLESLAQLVNKSLVVADRAPGRETRYQLHETIGQFARVKLEGTGEVGYIRDRHQTFYCALALDLHQRTNRPTDAGRILDQEMANLRLALEWLSAQENWETLGQLSVLLGDYWSFQGHLLEGVEWLDLVLEHRSAVSQPLASSILKAKGNLLFEGGKYGQARAFYRDSLAIYRALGDEVGIANLLNLVGHTAQMLGHLKEAEEYYQESLANYRSLGIKHGIATNLNRLAHIAYYRDEIDRAGELLQECLVIRREEANTRGLASTLNMLGEVARARGQYILGREFYEHALALCKQLGDKRCIAGIYHNLAHTAYQLGAAELSGSLFRASLTQYHELDNIEGCVLCLMGLVLIALSSNDYRRAAKLVGKSEAILRERSLMLGMADRHSWKEAVTRTKEQVEIASLYDVLTYGSEMPLEEVIPYALKD